MSFREHDKKTFIADTARDFAARRISKRDFLKKLGMAGVGLSAFSAGPARQPPRLPRRHQPDRHAKPSPRTPTSPSG